MKIKCHSGNFIEILHSFLPLPSRQQPAKMVHVQVREITNCSMPRWHGAMPAAFACRKVDIAFASDANRFNLVRFTWHVVITHHPAVKLSAWHQQQLVKQYQLKTSPELQGVSLQPLVAFWWQSLHLLRRLMLQPQWLLLSLLQH
jgi:hypothetical protein